MKITHSSPVASRPARRTEGAQISTQSIARQDHFSTSASPAPRPSERSTAAPVQQTAPSLISPASFDRLKLGHGVVFSVAQGQPDAKGKRSFGVLSQGPGGSNRFEVFKPDSAGAYQSVFSKTLSPTHGEMPGVVTAIDIDGDGKQEWLVGGSSAGAGLVVVKEDPSGALTEGPVSLPGLGLVRELVICGDHLVASRATQGREELVLLRPTSNGLEQTQVLPFAQNNGLAQMVCADFDGDGTLSVAWINNSGGGLYGGEAFVEISRLVNGQLSPPRRVEIPNLVDGLSLDAQDLDGDGRADLVVAGGGGVNDFPGMFAVLINKGTAGFVPSILPTPGSAGVNHPSSIRVGDLDRDGKKEIYFPGGGDLQTVRVVMLGKNGTAEGEASLTTLGSSREVSVAEIDGKLCLVAQTDDGVEVLLKR
jgi:hypothetical protein